MKLEEHDDEDEAAAAAADSECELDDEDDEDEEDEEVVIDEDEEVVDKRGLGGNRADGDEEVVIGEVGNVRMIGAKAEADEFEADEFETNELEAERCGEGATAAGAEGCCASLGPTNSPARSR